MNELAPSVAPRVQTSTPLKASVSLGDLSAVISHSKVTFNYPLVIWCQVGWSLFETVVWLHKTGNYFKFRRFLWRGLPTIKMRRPLAKVNLLNRMGRLAQMGALVLQWRSVGGRSQANALSGCFRGRRRSVSRTHRQTNRRLLAQFARSTKRKANRRLLARFTLSIKRTQVVLTKSSRIIFVCLAKLETSNLLQNLLQKDNLMSHF